MVSRARFETAWSSGSPAGANPHRGYNKRCVQRRFVISIFQTLNKKSAKNFIPITFSRNTRRRSLDSFRFTTAVVQWNWQFEWPKKRWLIFCLLIFFFFLPWPNSPSGRRRPQYRRFTITLIHTTLGRTPLDEWSDRRRDL